MPAALKGHENAKIKSLQLSQILTAGFIKYDNQRINGGNECNGNVLQGCESKSKVLHKTKITDFFKARA